MTRFLLLGVALVLTGCAGAPIEQAASAGARDAAKAGAYLGGIALGQEAVRAIRR